MPPDNFGPWTTSLTAGSRLELSAFWRGRLTRLTSVADGPLTSRWPGKSAVFIVAVATALFPMLRAQSEPVVALEPVTVAKEDAAAKNVLSPVSSFEEDLVAEVPPGEVPRSEVAASATGSDDAQAGALQKALRVAVAFLSGSQRDDGSWNQQQGVASTFRTGRTSLSALAMVQAGVKPNDLRLRRAADFLRAQKPGMTYEVALQTLALCALEPKRDAELIQRNAQWLEEGQLKNGPNRGGWSYGSSAGVPQGGGDNSNSDFAIWGLDAAAKAGAIVRRATWEAALGNWLRGQSADGGWSYTGGQNSTGSMTTAGVASVAICLGHLTNDERQPSPQEQAALDRGLQWMRTNFAVGHNPATGAGAGTSQWILYYAVMFRRAADVTQSERLGERDWRREFAEYFVSQQNKVHGTWQGSGIEADPVLGTSLVLLALVGADPAQPAK